MSKYRIAINTDVAARLKALRRLRGITQEQLAEQTGLCEQTIRLYENAHLGISPARLEDLAAALHTTPDHLASGGPR